MKSRLECIVTFLLAGLFVSASFAARGKVVDLGFPSSDFDGSRAFCAMYDFAWNTGSGPCIYTGHSVGGNQTYRQAAGNAANTVCATPHGWKHDAPDMALEEVPVYTQTGSNDFGAYDVQMVQQANAMGLRESIGWARGLAHNWSNPGLMYLFWAECIRLRYPPGSSLRNTPREEGWLGDMSSESWESDCPYVAPYREYRRDKAAAAWLPTRYFAFCWRGFVLGQGISNTNPIVITKPVPGSKWESWPQYAEGDTVEIQALCSNKGESRVDILYGDNVIRSFPKTAYGVYSAKWRAVAGIHGILAVSYNSSNQPTATSRVITVIVNGNVSYPPVDNSGLENAEPYTFGATSAGPVSGTSEVLRTRQRCTGYGSVRYVLLNGRTLLPLRPSGTRPAGSLTIVWPETQIGSGPALLTSLPTPGGQQ